MKDILYILKDAFNEDTIEVLENPVTWIVLTAFFGIVSLFNI